MNGWSPWTSISSVRSGISRLHVDVRVAGVVEGAERSGRRAGRPTTAGRTASSNGSISMRPSSISSRMERSDRIIGHRLRTPSPTARACRSPLPSRSTRPPSPSRPRETRPSRRPRARRPRSAGRRRAGVRVRRAGRRARSPRTPAGHPRRRSSSVACSSPSPGGVELGLAYPPVRDVEHGGRAGRRELVEAVARPEQPVARSRAARGPRRSAEASAGRRRPITCANGLAGFVSGPRKLNTVGTRSSRRTGPA